MYFQNSESLNSVNGEFDNSMKYDLYCKSIQKLMKLSLTALLYAAIFCVTICHKITVNCGSCQEKTCLSGNCILFSSQYGYMKQEICADLIWSCDQDQFPVTFYSKECENTRFRPDFFNNQLESNGNIYDCPTKCCIDDSPQFLNQVCVINPSFKGHRLCEYNQFWIVILCLICLVSTFAFIYYKENQNKQTSKAIDNEPERQMNQSMSNSKSSSYQSNALVSSKQSMEEGGMMKMNQMGIDHEQPQKKGPKISQTK